MRAPSRARPTVPPRDRPTSPAAGRRTPATPAVLLAAAALAPAPLSGTTAPGPAHGPGGGSAHHGADVASHRRGPPAGPARRAPADTLPPASPLAGRSWKAWARDGLAFAALFALDRPLRTAARELEADAPEGGLLDDAADRAEWFGDWEASLPWIVGGSLAVGGVTGGTDGAREAAALLAGAAAGSFANEAVNRATGRGRPAWEEGAFSLHPFRGHASFPSGHTAYVFGVASGVDVVTDGWLPAAAAYGVAGATGLSRIYHDRHWLTDVVAGAALSTVVSRVATRRALELLGAGEEKGPGGGPATAGRRRAAARDGGRTPGLRPPSPRVELLATPRALGVTIRF